MADVSQLIGQGIGFLPGSVKFVVTDGLGIGIAAPAPPFTPAFLVKATLEDILSHILRSGYAQSGQVGQLRQMPSEGGTHCALWLRGRRVAILSLNTVITTFDISIRLYRNAFEEPTELIETELARSISNISYLLLGDYSLAGKIRNIDAGGEFGEAMAARWGYEPLAGVICRVVTLQCGLVVNDTASLVA